MTSTSDSAASLPQQLRERAARFYDRTDERLYALSDAELDLAAADALERAERQLAQSDAVIKLYNTAWKAAIGTKDEMVWESDALDRHASRVGAP